MKKIALLSLLVISILAVSCKKNPCPAYGNIDKELVETHRNC